MNKADLEFLVDWLSQTNTGNAQMRRLSDGSPQIRWDDGKYECSITVFPPGPDTEMLKTLSDNMNEVVWCGNIRFTRTNL